MRNEYYADLDDNHDIIVDAFTELLDCDEDITFDAVRQLVKDGNGIQITEDEYRRVRAIY